MKKKIFNLILIIYLLIQVLIYIFGVFIPVWLPPYILDFSAIFINLIFAFYLYFYTKSIDNIIVILALLFTVFADIGLVLLEKWYQLSVGFFCVTQLLYAWRLRYSYKRILPLKYDLLIRFLFVILFNMIAYIVLKDSFDLLIVLTITYFINLLVNIVYAFINFKHARLFALGLFIFMFCDISVGLSQIGVYLNINPNSIINQIFNGSFDIIWFFYLPSQVLIVYSIIEHKRLGGNINAQNT